MKMMRSMSTRPQNRIEKIASKFALNAQKVYSGDFCSIQPRHVMTHDNTGAVLSKYDAYQINAARFKSIGAQSVKNPLQIVFTLDHNVQDTSPTASINNLEKYQRIADFAKKHSIDFYPAGSGIGHQIMIEQGYAFPNTLVVASDSHSNMYGGIGCLGTPIVRTDAASIWATGRTWWQVPPVTRVKFINQLPQGCSGKDIIIALCGIFNQDQVLNHAIEFVGQESISTLTVDDRLAIANMTTEWGALAGVFPVDKVTLSWLKKRARILSQSGKAHPRHSNDLIARLAQDSDFDADMDAHYVLDIELDLAQMSPYISGPNSVKVATPLAQLESKEIKIDKAYLVSCVNSRVSDLKAAAQVIKGKTVATGVEFYIAAASANVQKESELLGDWKVLLDAGARPLPAGCGPCIGLGAGLLKDNEVGISATNRNYKGRMGSPLAQTFLASPAVVAASAVQGYICGPSVLSGVPTPLNQSPQGKVRQNSILQRPTNPTDLTTYPGFESTLSGELIFCDHNNLNTDGIYPGKYTYQDDLSPSKMAKNDVLVGGFNFGTGSSREQAATALKYAGIRLVLAGSFSETFKRNAINNGLLVLEAPELVSFLRLRFSNEQKALTRRTGMQADVDLGIGRVNIMSETKSFAIPAVGMAAQEVMVYGGLESWIKSQIER